jgi:hypothetical protein
MDDFTADGRKIITIAPYFSVADRKARADFLFALNEIDTCAKKNRKTQVDMTSVKQLKAEPALLLFAYITAAQVDSGHSDIVKVILPKDRDVKALIRASGLWDVIKVGTSRKLDRNWQTNNHFQSGYDPNKHLELTLLALEKEYGTIPNKLGVAINEAVLNIVQHAYQSGVLTRWWQYIYISDNKLNFFIYDRGRGIPSHFRRNGQYTNLSDQAIIAKAMERGITSTRVPGRGNGSENIKKPVKQLDKDYMRIISEWGSYTYSEDSDIQLSQMPVYLEGTLISWQIKVSNDE